MTLSVCCLPFISTMSHAITSTTHVRMAVPRFDSTPSMPILPRMEVSDANTADKTAYRSHLFFSGFSPESAYFSIILNVPLPIRITAMPLNHETGSPRNTIASRMVRTVEDLSMGTTLLTLPNCKALK